MLERLRWSDGARWFGEALLDQSLVAGIGNMWLAEALWEARLSPWRRLATVGEDERRRALETAAELMRASVDRRPRRAEAGLSPGRAAVPALPDADPVVGAGRRQPHGVLVPDVPGRREPARRVLTYVGSHRTPLRAPHLYESLRGFCLGAFAAERGAQVPFAFEEHATQAGPSLYEYRPLVRGFVEEQAPTLRRLPDARNAIDDLKREPAAAIFARAHAGIGDTGDDALFRSILLPMLTWTAERCGGFDWNDEAFDAAYADLEQTLFGTNRTYVALAPRRRALRGHRRRPRRRTSPSVRSPRARSRSSGRRRRD